MHFWNNVIVFASILVFAEVIRGHGKASEPSAVYFDCNGVLMHGDSTTDLAWKDWEKQDNKERADWLLSASKIEYFEATWTVLRSLARFNAGLPSEERVTPVIRTFGNDIPGMIREVTSHAESNTNVAAEASQKYQLYFMKDQQVAVVRNWVGDDKVPVCRSSDNRALTLDHILWNLVQVGRSGTSFRDALLASCRCVLIHALEGGLLKTCPGSDGKVKAFLTMKGYIKDKILLPWLAVEAYPVLGTKVGACEANDGKLYDLGRSPIAANSDPDPRRLDGVFANLCGERGRGPLHDKAAALILARAQGFNDFATELIDSQHRGGIEFAIYSLSALSKFFEDVTHIAGGRPVFIRDDAGFVTKNGYNMQTDLKPEDKLLRGNAKPFFVGQSEVFFDDNALNGIIEPLTRNGQQVYTDVSIARAALANLAKGNMERGMVFVNAKAPHPAQTDECYYVEELKKHPFYQKSLRCERGARSGAERAYARYSLLSGPALLAWQGLVAQASL